MDAAQAKKVGAIAVLILALTGIGVWGFNRFSISAEQRQQQDSLNDLNKKIDAIGK